MPSKYLIDTHILIWLSQEPEMLSIVATAIVSSDALLFVSHASIWEMAIKIKTGKLELGQSLEEFIEDAVNKFELQLLPISPVHIYHTQQLFLHHRDPFDRLLISQSIVEGMPFISADDVMELYKVQRIWK